MAAEIDVTTIDEDDVPEDTAVDDEPAETLDETTVEEVGGNGTGTNGSGAAGATVVEPEVEEDLDSDLDAEVTDDELVVAPVDDEGDEEAESEAVPPATRPSRRRHRAEMKASARRVRRVVRHIDTWSVFKVATLFVACVWGIVVLASLLIWRAAVSSGSVENTEDFIVDLGFEDFEFDPQQMFEALLSAGAVAAIAAIFFVWLLTVLFNLICDLTGGIRVTMIEQDLADARKRRGRRSATPEPAEADPTD